MSTSASGDHGCFLSETCAIKQVLLMILFCVTGSKEIATSTGRTVLLTNTFTQEQNQAHFASDLNPLGLLAAPLISSMTTVNHPAITELPPAATVKQITLDDGQQASVVIQGGRITKILAANGQVAELSWKDDAASSTNWRVKYHHLPPSEQ